LDAVSRELIWLALSITSGKAGRAATFWHNRDVVERVLGAQGQPYGMGSASTPDRCLRSDDTFERFTDRAWRVVVQAEEARKLSHNFIGTGHILLALVHEAEGAAG
jgi:hypothetical protein